MKNLNTLGYAVELYFDRQTEQSIENLRHVLIERGISSMLDKSGDRPHISLAVFSDVACDILVLLTQKYAVDMEPFDVRLSAIGTFPTDENVLFLVPAPTLQLLTYHQEFHRRLAKSKLMPSPYYSPANWMPHCSVDMNISDEQLPKAIEFCRKAFKPLLGQIQEIGVTEFRPIKHLATWPLTAKTR